MVIDVTEATFAEEVIARSHTVPVIADFWAEWCGPCKQLGPAIETAVNRHEGRVVLAKVDTDANPQLARQYGIQSIPAVKAFVDGVVAAEFVGLKPPAELDKFLAKLLPSEADQLVAAGDETSLRRALELEPERADASLLLAQIAYDTGELDTALELLDNVPKSFLADGLRARIELEQAGQPDVSAAFAALDAGELERGLDALLAAFPAADGKRDVLRRAMVGVLSELDPADPMGRDYRRRLSAALG